MREIARLRRCTNDTAKILYVLLVYLLYLQQSCGSRVEQPPLFFFFFRHLKVEQAQATNPKSFELKVN